MCNKMQTTVLLLLLLAGSSYSARILGILPTPAHSHQKPFLNIMSTLAERGHQVTVITTQPLKDPPKNMTQIDMAFTAKTIDMKPIIKEMSSGDPVKLAERMLGFTEQFCNQHLNYTKIKHLLHSNEKFDLVVFETFFHWCYFGFIHKLGAPPVVGLFPTTPMVHINTIMGNPINPSYMPDISSAYTDHMDFWQRMDNAYTTYRLIRSFYNVILPFHEKEMWKYVGTDVPRLTDMVHNMSLLISANDFVLNYAQPRLPNVVEVTGLHISKQRKPLPKEIQQFLDGAESGFVYFSLGSNMKSEYLPDETRNALLEAFAAIPQRVLWKFELDDLPGKPDNVMISKWLPQSEVLAHRNIRLFFTHGGLQSFNEATYFAVPLLAMPFFGDQRYNVAKMMATGVGEKIELAELSKESILSGIRGIVENTSYSENMKRLSAVYREQQETSLERAVSSIEYVLRHNGAPHLRPAALDLQWWQLLLLDVVAFVLAVAAAAAFVLYKVVHFFVSVLRHDKQKRD